MAEDAYPPSRKGGAATLVVAHQVALTRSAQALHLRFPSVGVTHRGDDGLGWYRCRMRMPQRICRSGTAQRAPAAERIEDTANLAGLGGLRPLGQLQNSFILAVNEEGLWIIDQHVAHERVLFEKVLRERQTEQVQRQRLLMPLLIDLLPAQMANFAHMAEELERNGFEAEPFGPRTLAVKAAPAGLEGRELELALAELLQVEDDASAGRQHGCAAAAHCGQHRLPCGGQDQHAAGTEQNAVAAGRTWEKPKIPWPVRMADPSHCGMLIRRSSERFSAFRQTQPGTPEWCDPTAFFYEPCGSSRTKRTTGFFKSIWDNLMQARPRFPCRPPQIFRRSQGGERIPAMSAALPRHSPPTSNTGRRQQRGSSPRRAGLAHTGAHAEHNSA